MNEMQRAGAGNRLAEITLSASVNATANAGDHRMRFDPQTQLELIGMRDPPPDQTRQSIEEIVL